MSRARFLVLTVGPVVIMGLSAAGAWLTAHDEPPPPINQVYLASFSAPASPVGSEQRKSAFDLHAASGESAALELESACREATEHLRQRLARWPESRRWSVLASPPFVVAGLVDPEELKRWRDWTVRPAARALWSQFFRARPTAPITVLLLPDESSYRRCAKWMFSDREVAYFGYYRPEDRTVVVNIGTGGGTLVHELTHALLIWDFPGVPAWFNEGLASLYEQCRFDGAGRIQGLVNWRLPELQEAIYSGRLRHLADLMAADDFHGAGEGLNYAQARYFCLYLQEHGVLEEFYAAFRAARSQEPSGTVILQRLFPNTSLEQLDTAFRRWVLSLDWSESSH